MDALILSCGTGGGHDSAGKAILEELKLRGHNAVMMNPYELRSGRLVDRINGAYIFAAQKAPWLFGIVYGIGHLYRKLPFRSPVYYANRKMAGVLNEYLKANRFDVIIMPHLFPAEIITNMKNCGYELPITIFVATDYTCIPFTEETDCDAYVIPGAELTDSFSRRGIPKDKIHTLGIPVGSSYAKKETMNEARARMGLDPNKKYILVTGGSMGGGKIKKAIRLLKESVEASDNTELIVVCGTNERLYDSLKKECSPKVHIIGYTNDMAGYMRAADIFVTKPGGLSSSEAAVSGVPIIHTAAIPGCETFNMRYFYECGMSESWDLSKKGLYEALKRLCDERVRHSMVSNQQRISNPNAAREICELAEDLSKRKMANEQTKVF